MSITHKYVIKFGKFARHEDEAGRPLPPEKGGQLVIKRPGDIVSLTVEQAQAKQQSVQLATDAEIDAYERRLRGDVDAPPLPDTHVSTAGAPPAPTPSDTMKQGSGPLGSQAEVGVRLTDPEPAGKPAAQPVAPAATAQAPVPAAPAPAAPATPAAAPAPGPAGIAAPSTIPAADANAKPRARSQGKAKSGGKKSGSRK